MSLFERISRSWDLIKLSWRVLMHDKELLLFPVLSTIAGIALFIGLVLPSFLVESLSIPALALWYFTSAFVTIFMNAALFACVKKRLKGGDPTIGYGLKEASKHVVAILIWSLVTTTVGLILRQLEQWAEDNFLAQIVISIIGIAWSLMTMFVVPVIVIEGAGTFDAMKRSANLFRKTWGENLAADISIGLGFFMLYAAAIVVGLVTLFLMPIIFFPVLILLVLYVAVVAVFQSTLSMVFDAVLYSYAVGDNVPLEFKGTVGKVFVKKENRRR